MEIKEQKETEEAENVLQDGEIREDVSSSEQEVKLSSTEQVVLEDPSLEQEVEPSSTEQVVLEDPSSEQEAIDNSSVKENDFSSPKVGEERIVNTRLYHNLTDLSEVTSFAGLDNVINERAIIRDFHGYLPLADLLHSSNLDYSYEQSYDNNVDDIVHTPLTFQYDTSLTFVNYSSISLTNSDLYPFHRIYVMILRSVVDMTRKLSVTVLRKSFHFFGIVSRRNVSIASANSLYVL